jgi:RNA polymerase sigma-70 factor (ECF subfamily)
MTHSPRLLRLPVHHDNVGRLPAGAPVEDADLVGRACGGDRLAEQTLYQRHVGYVTGMVVRLLGSRTEAEDVVQDTFAIGLHRLSTLRQPEAVRGWFATIAVRLVRRRLRRTKLFAPLGLDASTSEPNLESLAVEADAETRAELAAIGRVLARLSTNDRIAWMLHHVEGETLEQVAELCGCSLATAKRRILAAATAVRRHVGAMEESP